MRPYKLMGFIVLLTITMTGIAGAYSAHAGPPDKYEHSISQELATLISYDITLDAINLEGVPEVYSTPPNRLEPGLYVPLVYDHGKRVYAVYVLNYDFNRWQRHIRPLLPEKFKSVQLRT
jgi:hypothetical protein